MKKKICIVTWYTSSNCGTCLQARALYEVIKSKYDVCMLHGRRKYSIFSIRDWRIVAYKVIKKIKDYNKKSTDIITISEERQEKIDAFSKESYEFLYFTSRRKYKKMENDVDCFVVGSDQLWNPYWYDGKYYLDFVNDSNKKKSYATSIGISELPQNVKKKMRKHLKEFSTITVREKKASELLTNLLERSDIEVVADPTFLLTGDEWRMIYKNKSKVTKLDKKYLICYFVGGMSEHKEAVENIAQKLQLEIVVIPMNNKDYTVENVVFEEAGPYEFLDLIDNAEYVCTDSFHALAISLSMSKNFSVFERKITRYGASQNSRIDELLMKYSLQESKYNEHIGTISRIDYKKVQEQMQLERQKSRNKLFGML